MVRISAWACCSLLIMLAMSLPCAAQSKPAKPLNIVFIFSDDHAYQAISAYNDPRKLIETPNLDRIAREGMLFNRCLVPNSICGPVRAVIQTGKYSHLNGFYNNSNSRFDSSQTTFPKLLQGAGYQTAIIGKWHLGSDPAGYDHWDILPGQGAYYNPPMIRNGEKTQNPGYVTDIITDKSLEWLDKRDPNKPFMLMCQHKAPHREWSPALRHLGHDADRKYAEPENLFDDYANRGLAVRDQDMTLEKTFNKTDAKLGAKGSLTPEQSVEWKKYYEPRNAAFEQANLAGKELIRWRYNRYMHDYLGCVKAVDESVGRVLKYLDDHGLAENTVVVYSSDQGFYLGEHGWFDKRWIFEESLRTPLLVRWPGVTKPGSVNNDLVSVLDYPETLLDAAGVKIPDEMQGRSLRPVLAGETPADWRKSFYYHYYEYPQPHHVRPHYGVVTDRFKLVHFYKPDVDYWELYDRQNDPLEMRDVSKLPENATKVEELKKEIQRLRTELKVPAEDAPRASGNNAKQQPNKQPPAKKKAAA